MKVADSGQRIQRPGNACALLKGVPCVARIRDPQWTLAETDVCRISAWSEAVLPGYACVLSKRHVIEPFDLEEDDQAAFFLDAMAAARGLAKLFDSVKMNYEIHGNTVPHLHIHLFPRMPGDVYVGFPNHCRASFTRSDEEIAQMAKAVKAELAGRLVF